MWFGLDTVPTSLPFLTFGRRLGHYFVDIQGLPSMTCCVASGVGVTDLLVARFRQAGLFTSVDLWVNSTNFAAPPNISAVMPTIPFTWLNLEVQPGLFADEVRLGTTAGSVAAAFTGVPEPGTFVLIGLALALAQCAMTCVGVRTSMRSIAGRPPDRVG
ncbi:MAG TPA: hypothetical protein VGS58_13335 [Candidatus Sulfopaludibacter sp.]|nr:hypothetical protein [Candidatus Sulfopaludibacter sp.]